MQEKAQRFIPFALWMTRFVDEEKAYIVYDHARGLEAYARTREPERFAATIIVTDGFHASNHGDCSPILDIKVHRHRDVPKNSEACEQTNKKMKAIASQLHYMKLPNAVVYIAIWQELFNLEQDEREKEDLDVIGRQRDRTLAKRLRV